MRARGGADFGGAGLKADDPTPRPRRETSGQRAPGSHRDRFARIARTQHALFEGPGARRRRTPARGRLPRAPARRPARRRASAVRARPWTRAGPSADTRRALGRWRLRARPPRAVSSASSRTARGPVALASSGAASSATIGVLDTKRQREPALAVAAAVDPDHVALGPGVDDGVAFGPRLPVVERTRRRFQNFAEPSAAKPTLLVGDQRLAQGLEPREPAGLVGIEQRRGALDSELPGAAQDGELGLTARPSGCAARRAAGARDGELRRAGCDGRAQRSAGRGHEARCFVRPAHQRCGLSAELMRAALRSGKARRCAAALRAAQPARRWLRTPNRGRSPPPPPQRDHPARKTSVIRGRSSSSRSSSRGLAGFSRGGERRAGRLRSQHLTAGESGQQRDDRERPGSHEARLP